MSTSNLIAELDSETKLAQTQSLDISFNELFDMYQDEELNISPEYQRIFRWTTGAQSRFIESLLLEMPVPPIYVIEDEIGKYELIDGLQRLSSYFHFRGVLNSPDSIPPVSVGDHLELTDCDIVKNLNGLKFSDLPTSLQIRLKRAFVRVEVIRKSSDPRLKYHMFKRLNTGGVLLSVQQVRNCTIRLLDSTFTDFLVELARNEDFRICTETLTNERRRDSYDEELVLRFFALKNDLQSFKHDVSDFLTDYMERISDPDAEDKISFDYEAEKVAFEKTFKALAQSIGDAAFSFANAKSPVKLVSGFSVYHFEAFTIGIQQFLGRYGALDADQLSLLRQEINAIKRDQRFITITTGGGKNSPGPLMERIGFVSDWLGALPV